jgi:Ran GTPase-activating protein (RanGAP) involved in mRNA processing and transport
MDRNDPLQHQQSSFSNANLNDDNNNDNSGSMLDVQRTSNNSFVSPSNPQMAGSGPSQPPTLMGPFSPMTVTSVTTTSNRSTGNNNIKANEVIAMTYTTTQPLFSNVPLHSENTNTNVATNNGMMFHSGGIVASSNASPFPQGPYPPSSLPPPTRESVLQRLSEALLRRSLAKIDLSQKGLGASDARLVKMALLQNRQLRVLKLGYNQLGDAGIQALVAGIAQHGQLQMLDLGFNNISDVGCQFLAQALTHCGQLQTLYLAGNCIGQQGAMALAHVLKQPTCGVQKLYMTGNRLGADGVKALTQAILEEAATHRRYNNNNHRNGRGDDQPMMEDGSIGSSNVASSTFSAATVPSSSSLSSLSAGAPAATTTRAHRGMQELFLGGTGLGSAGCQAIGQLLASPDCSLKVLSLANCDITDEEITRQDGGGIAMAIKGNRQFLPLQSLQLSFNGISHKGLEALMNALWGSTTLQELRIDNNDIGDRGAQQIAAILPYLKTLETLDVGFNNINNKNSGMKILMKAVAETNNLKTLSLSGNPMQDVASAKAVAYALAYNTSLQSLLLVHCHLTTEGQRHVAAGAVSNSRSSLRDLSGFPVGRK